MRIKEGESYESWCERVRMYEHGWAMQQIAEGKDVDKILDNMARRITEKLMHPIFNEIRKSSSIPYDAETGKKDYEEKYLKVRGPVADHVDGNLFDKD